MTSDFSASLNRLSDIASKPLPENVPDREALKAQVEEIIKLSLALERQSIISSYHSDLAGRICGHLVEALNDLTDLASAKRNIEWAMEDIRRLRREMPG